MAKKEFSKTREEGHIALGTSSRSGNYLIGLFWAISFLLGLGIVQVYSASFIFAIESYDDGLFFVKKQAFFVLLAFVVLGFFAAIPWKWAERIAIFAFLLSVFGIVMTQVPGFGIKVGGATRWLSLGEAYRFEPSELFKYTVPVYLAFLLAGPIRGRGFLTKSAAWLLLLAPLGVLLRQPDFGSFVIILLAIFFIFFARGMSWAYVGSIAGSMIIAFYVLVMNVPYRRARIEAFIDPWSDPAQKGFQVIQSLLGFHAGGLTGVGLGQGQGKLFFLPEAHTDFTLSVLGEEMGFLGILAVLFLYGFIVFRGLQISARVNDERKKTLSLGVILVFAMTVIINVGVTMGLLPTKGLGIPFLSYGGSALIAVSLGLGLLLNIDRSNNLIDGKSKSFYKIQN